MENMATIEEEELLELQLSGEGQLARNILIDDLKALRDHGASPVLNVIRRYDRDELWRAERDLTKSARHAESTDSGNTR